MAGILGIMDGSAEPLATSDGIHLSPLPHNLRRLGREDPLAFARAFRTEIIAPSGPESSAIYTSGAIPVLLTAGHSVTHYRNGIRKVLDLHTGPFVLSVALRSAAYSLVATHLVNEDPNYSRQSQFRDAVDHISTRHSLRFVIDLHGARSPRGHDIALGTAGAQINLPLSKIVASEFGNRGFTTIILGGGAYSGAGHYTLAKHLTLQKIPTVQIELSRALRDPARYPIAYLTAIDALQASILHLYPTPRA